MSKIKLSKDFIRNTVKRALNEDLYPSGDITSSLIKNNKNIKVKLLSNENAIVGGLLFAKQAFDLVDNKIKFNMIYDVIYRTFDVMPMSKILEIESIYEIDKQSRMEAHKVVKSIT